MDGAGFIYEIQPRCFLRSRKCGLVDVEGGVAAILSYVEVKGPKGGSRGKKLYISQVHEWAHLEVQSDKQLSLIGVLRVRQTLEILS